MIPIILAVLAILGGGGAAVASQNSLPGDTLYPVKTLTENVRLLTDITPEAKATTRIEYLQKRITEIEKLLENAKKGENADKIATAVQSAMDNFNEQIDNISKQAGELKNSGNLAKAGEINSALKSDLDIYHKVLEKDAKDFENDGEIKRHLDDAVDSVASSTDEIANEKDNIDENEKGEATKERADGKINAAQNKIDEVEKFISDNPQKATAGIVNKANEKLSDAKIKLAEAKDYLVNNEFGDAFDKAKDAMEKAQEAKSIISSSNLIEENDIDVEDMNATSTENHEYDKKENKASSTENIDNNSKERD